MTKFLKQSPALTLCPSPEDAKREENMRTRLSICRKKARYPAEAEALAAASRAPFALHPYRCERCWQFHLTSRTKGKRVLRPQT
jgi:hypothetical protein